MRAVDVECFAGGFTLGVSQAGFELVGKRELPGGFGVPSVKANEHLLNRSREWEVQVSSAEEWSAVDVGLVFGNPPCSAFSGVSDKFFAGADNKINECMFALVDYGARCRAPVIAYESVQNAYTKGLPLLRDLHRRLEAATGDRYALHHVLHNGASVGGCAVRKRYFWVAARLDVPLGFAYDGVERVPTLFEAIADLTGLRYDSLEAQPYVYGPSWWAADKRSATGLVDGHLAFRPQYHRQSQALLDQGAWYPGESLSTALRRYLAEHDRWPSYENERDFEFARHYGPGGRDLNFGGAWQPERWRYERAARVVTGGSSARSIHPVEPRPLTLREMFRIQGFPDDWQLKPATEMANANTAALWPGKGIPVQAGRWLATCVRAALEGAPRDDGRLRATGDREFVWDGTSDHRRVYDERTGQAPRAVPKSTTVARRSLPPAATSKETQVTTDADAERVRRELETTGTSTVSLAGLDPKEAKKTKELLYGAAYAMGRKVKVKTDKAASTATGVLTDEAHVPAARKAAATPAPAAPSEAMPGGRLKDPKLGDRVQDANGRWYVYTGEGTGPFGTGYSLDSPESNGNQLTFDLPFDDVDELGADVPVMEPLPAGLEVTEAGSDDASEERQYDTQPKTSSRRKKVADRRYDLTQLREASHGYYVHRDYAAHYFRWGWAARWVKQTTKLLDLGSGQDLALARVLIYHNGLPDPKQGGEMVCVDLNKLKEHVQPKWLTVYDETDFTVDWKKLVDVHGLFDLVSCFEVIEHMGVDDGDRLLAAIKCALAPEGKVLLSTPVFNGKAAVNHVHEYSVDELAASVTRAGFQVLDRRGTFGSYHDTKRGLAAWFDYAAFARFPDQADRAAVAQLVVDFYERLREYYADDVLAAFMAPNLPDHARNNVWVLGHAT